MKLKTLHLSYLTISVGQASELSFIGFSASGCVTDGNQDVGPFLSHKVAVTVLVGAVDISTFSWGKIQFQDHLRGNLMPHSLVD